MNQKEQNKAEKKIEIMYDEAAGIDYSAWSEISKALEEGSPWVLSIQSPINVSQGTSDKVDSDN